MIIKPTYKVDKKINNAYDLLTLLLSSSDTKDIATFLSESIIFASNLDQSRVSINYRKDKKLIRVNVGKIEVANFSRFGLLVVMDYNNIDKQLKMEINESWQYPEDRPTAYKSVPNSFRIRFNPNDLKEYYKQIREANNELIKLAIQSGPNVWMKSNNIETIKTLQDLSGLNLPVFEEKIDSEMNKRIEKSINNNKSDSKRQDINVETYNDENYEPRIMIDISEEFSEDLLVGDLESIDQLIKNIEKSLYEDL